MILALALVARPHLELFQESRLKQEGALAAIHERKSVRNYTDEVVSPEMLERLVHAGLAAPSAADKRPWAFLVVTHRTTLDLLGERLAYAEMLPKAPAAIVVCGLPGEGIQEPEENEYWVQDVSAATQNVLLAVEALGLGSVWVGVFPVEEKVATVREILALPAEVIPFSILPVGYPLREQPAKNKTGDERVYWEHWGD